MAEYIEREAFYLFLTEQKEKETGTYSKGRNAGLNVARSALHNREITPSADVAPVIFCRKCAHHGRCAAESIYLSEGIAEPFCCRGEPKEGDG